jgi:hypothetical protein
MKKILFGAVCCILFSCNNGKKEIKTAYKNNKQSLIQERNVGGILLHVTYLPVYWERLLGRDNPSADQEISFKLNIVPPKTTGELQRGTKPVMEVDTLFDLIAGQDTIPALFAQQIANGNPSSAEYLVTFKRRTLENNTTLQLVFKDWVYTHSRMVFPFEVKNIKNIDSLSSRL